MSRRGQIIALPFLLVPLILLLVVGSIVVFRRGPAREPAALAAGSAATAVPPQTGGGPLLTTAQPVPTVPAAVRAPEDQEDALLTALYKDRSPAVVAIRILGAPAAGGPIQLPRITPRAGPDATPEPGGPNGEPGAPEFGFQAQGSGFLIDGQGHVVTNNHVVENAKNIEVTFTDGSTVEAQVVGTDVDSDLAVLKVSRVPAGVKPLQFGDSKKVQVGQRAIAIGNPFGLSSTLTVGVVSARGRTLPARSAGQTQGVFSLADVLQTDTAVNPGNSGGPLFNSAGEVIGINQSIRSESGAFEGVSFAIPSNTVKKVVTALITKGKYDYPYLGIGMNLAPITDAVARELKLPVQHGVPVTGIEAGTPAAKAGIKAGTGRKIILGQSFPTGGDIILKIDDKVVNSSADVIDYLATDTEVGQTVTVTVLRDGKEVKVPVVLGARPKAQ